MTSSIWVPGTMRPGATPETTFSPAGGLWVLMADGDVVEYQIDAGASAR